MPDYWQFPTVSMGLGRSRRSTWRAISSISRRAAMRRPPTARCGCSAATARWTSRVARRHRPRLAREARQPDLHRQLQPAALDGPVRGNGKIIQELEGEFRGAGWNVIKVIWARTGIRCSRATRKAACCASWRRRSTASTRIQGQRRRLRAQEFLRQGSEGAGDGLGA